MVGSGIRKKPIPDPGSGSATLFTRKDDLSVADRRPDRTFWMTSLIYSCQDRKTIKCKFVSNFNQIPDIETMHFVPECTLLKNIYILNWKECHLERRTTWFQCLIKNWIELASRAHKILQMMALVYWFNGTTNHGLWASQSYEQCDTSYEPEGMSYKLRDTRYKLWTKIWDIKSHPCQLVINGMVTEPWQNLYVLADYQRSAPADDCRV
jgi:hypothetical protein